MPFTARGQKAARLIFANHEEMTRQPTPIDVIQSAPHYIRVSRPTPTCFCRRSTFTISGEVIYSEGFHTFGVEWSENFLYTYVDNRLLQVHFVGFGGQNMWTRSGLAAKGFA
jgi:hypothetical protein